MLTLFDEIVRTEKSARNRRQSFYASLNRSVGAEYDAIRQVLETWFCDYPSDPEQSRSLLQGKFRSDNNQNHLSAFFELYLYALLKHQAFVVSPEFVVDRVVGRPIDFRIQPTDALP